MDNSVYNKIKADMISSKRVHTGIFNSIENARADLMIDSYSLAEEKESLPAYAYKDFLANKRNIDYLVKCDKDLENTFLEIKPIDFEKVLKN